MPSTSGRQAFRVGGARASAAPEAAARTPARAARRTPAKKVSDLGQTQAVDRIDSSYLESLIGYNARRAALAVIAVFLERMAPYGLRPVDFSILSLITHNPGITARQLCHALGLLPPNMVGVINGFEKRGLIERRPDPADRRATLLRLTAGGAALAREAVARAKAVTQATLEPLAETERETLTALLRKLADMPEPGKP